MLHIILWTLVCVPIPYVLYTLIVTPESLTRTLAQATFVETTNIVLIFLLHRGYVKTASSIQVSAFWLFLTITAVSGDGVHGAAYLLGYTLVIMIAGSLLGGRGVLLFTAFSLISGGYMANLEMRGVINPEFTDTPLTTWIVSFLLFPVGAVLQHLASRKLQKTLVRARASEERYRLISQVSSDYAFSTTVHGDTIRLVEGVQNLLENAVKYAKPNGIPRIEVGTDGISKNGNPVFFVRDNGIGIETQYHERFFGLYNKLDVQSEGTGIGLSLVKKIIEIRNGRIWVESEIGSGAIFYFSLPAPYIKE